MTIGAPEWFWGFLILPLLAAFFLRNEVRREELLRKLVAARLLAGLAASMSALRRRWKYVLALLGLACVNAALTQPRVGYTIEETPRKGLDLIIAVDTSKSMLTQDVQPDRLTRAKFASQDLIDGLEGDRVGMIAFAGTPFVEAPLTVDYSAVLASLDDLDTNTIPRGGTNIAAAIRQAADAFGKGEGTHRALVLFTDGEELEDDAVTAAKEAKGQFVIFTVGVGSAEGALIPTPGSQGGTDFVKDDKGQFVKSKLDEAKLKQIAEATGGFYIHLDNGPSMAKAIIEQGLSKMQAKDFEAREAKPIERYEWPLAAGILLLISSMLIRERRRVIQPRRSPVVKKLEAAAVTAALLMLITIHAGAATNQGVQLYDQKDYKGAYDVFGNQLQRNPNSDGLEFDHGAAAYKSGDFDNAMEAFGKVVGSKDPALRSQAEYNLGNTLVQRGALQEKKDDKVKEWKDAINHYDQALKVDPKNGDAKYNEDIVRKMIEDLNKKEQQQQQQNQQNQKQDQKQDQQQKDQQQKDQQQKDQQQKDQQQKDQQQKDQQQKDQQQQNQQQQNQQGQGQQQKDQQGQDQQQKNQQSGAQGQQDQKQNGQPKQDEQKQGSPDQREGMNSPSPTPSPGETGNSPQNTANAPSPTPTPGNGKGELKEASQGSPSPSPQTENQAAAQGATEKAQPGEMTKSQAQALIDSLRGEDEHVSLYDRQPKDTEQTYKDW